MKKYQLINWKMHKIPITIDPSAKEDFKKLMEWTEEEFIENTTEIETEEEYKLWGNNLK